MQRCPYLHEMKERLLGQPEGLLMDRLNKEDVLEVTQDPHVGTIVKLNADGYGSHTSPARAPLVSAEECDEVTPAHGHTPAPNHHGHGHGYGHCCDHAHGCVQGHGGATVHQHSVACSPCGSPDFGLPLQPPMKPPKNAKTSLFIIMSFIYAKLLVVICIAYVISDVITHNLPLYYYEGFFTYLYGMSILFLLYVFCFLLQESACCNGSPAKPKPPPKEKKPKKEKEKKTKDKDGKKEGKSKDKDAGKDAAAGKDKSTKESKKQSQFQEVYPRKMRDKVREQQLHRTPLLSAPTQQQDIVEVETGITPIIGRRRKTSQNDHSHGSFFLRIGAIAFGLGTMIYNGLEFGTFFEVPFDSPCYQILRGVNPLLQMVFTFMQMYFIFMNSRLNIHRFKVVARFGLMHVAATNICVWIRTLVLESLKEITAYHLGRPNQPEDGIILESIRRHTLRHSAKFGSDFKQGAADTKVGAALATVASTLLPSSTTPKAYLTKLLSAVKATSSTPITTSSTTTHSIRKHIQDAIAKNVKTTIPPNRDPWFNPQGPNNPWANDNPWTAPTVGPVSTSMSTPLEKLTTKATYVYNTLSEWVVSTVAPVFTTSSTLAPTTNLPTTTTDFWSLGNSYRVDEPPHSVLNNTSGEIFESFDDPKSAALMSSSAGVGVGVGVANASMGMCPRINIMGSIVADSAPYLYPFIIEYSLIGAAVIYVMWKQIGRQSNYMGEEELERRLEAVLSRRAAALAAARRGGRVDCAGASKGLFCGLLLLVGALICLILFFVLVRHPRLGILAIYLADVSHCALMALSILAIIIGFIRVQSLKFRSEEQSDLNDILLRVSAFGLFVYSVFSVIAGSLGMFTSDANLLVMITGILCVVQVVLQLLFIADVSRRRVHLPEQERSKPARQAVTFLLICNLTMWMIYTFEAQKVVANPVQLDFYGFLAWSIVQRITLPLCIFHRFHSAVTLAEIWKTSYKARLE